MSKARLPGRVVKQTAQCTPEGDSAAQTAGTGLAAPGQTAKRRLLTTACAQTCTGYRERDIPRYPPKVPLAVLVAVKSRSIGAVPDSRGRRPRSQMVGGSGGL
jgi:hypothetical protein